MSSTSIDVGRVFFTPNDTNKVPRALHIVPLDCHVGNVLRLAEHWRCSDESEHSDMLYSATREFVLSACRYHDMAKPQTFRLKYHQERTKFEDRWTYSFAGHRFRVPPHNPYVDALIRRHHDFDVEEIVNEIPRIQREFQALLEQENLALPQKLSSPWEIPEDLLHRFRQDLYILEMCDQIEAELETRVFALLEEQEDQATTRNFMDFSIYPPGDGELQSEQPCFRVDPFPWEGVDDSSAIAMTYHIVTLVVPEVIEKELEKLVDTGNGTRAATYLRSWLVEQLMSGEGVTKSRELTITLAPPDGLAAGDESEGGPALSAKHLPGVLGFPELNPMQQEVAERILQPEEGFGLLLRSPTGSGKTEAVLWPCLQQGRRVVLALPARSLIDDQRERIAGILSRAAKLTGRRYAMVVDTGVASERWTFAPGSGERKREHRRHLYQGDVILTTLDKLLFRYFGFTDKTKSMIFPYRLHSKRTVLVFDEAHSYESLAWSNFRLLVQALFEAGQDLVLMTATMPPHLVKEFSYLDAIVDFIGDTDRRQSLESFAAKNANDKNQELFPSKKLRYIPARGEASETELVDDFDFGEEDEARYEDVFVQEIVDVWQRGVRRIICVVHTIRSAASLFQRLQKESTVPVQALHLYHGRLTERCWMGSVTDVREGRAKRVEHHSRATVYELIKEADQAEQPYVLVTTHAIEVGCDLNAEVLLTALCEPDALIQRAGRCNRRYNIPKAEVIVVGARIPDYMRTLSTDDFRNYRELLCKESGGVLEPNRLEAHIANRTVLEDPRLLESFAMLQEYVYQGDVLQEPLYKRGLVVTRSWEPTVTLRCSYQGCTYETSVPVERLRRRKLEDGTLEPVPDNVNVQQCVYRAGEKDPLQWVPFFGGDAYRIREVVVEFEPDVMIADGRGASWFVPELGFVDLPRVFNIFTPRGTRKRIAHYQPVQGKGGVMRYLAPWTEENS